MKRIEWIAAWQTVRLARWGDVERLDDRYAECAPCALRALRDRAAGDPLAQRERDTIAGRPHFSIPF